jgi:hypothetical protein
MFRALMIGAVSALTLSAAAFAQQGGTEHRLTLNVLLSFAQFSYARARRVLTKWTMKKSTLEELASSDPEG